MVMRFLTSGESHGKCLTAIIEGIPSGFNIDEDFINSELKRRQQGYGRGGRMKIENDEIEKINEIEKDYIMKSKIFFDSARKTVDEVFPKHNNASKAKLYIFNKILLIFKKN